MNNKILIFIEWYKPGYKAGGPIRSISNLVDYLAKKAEIYIITSDTDYLETTPYTSIQENKWQVVDNASVFYLSRENINYSIIKKLIKELNPNIIYCNSLYSPYFTIIPLYLAKKLRIKPILATRGMLSQGALAIKSNKKRLFLSIIKLLGLFKNIVFHATSEDEKKDIMKNFNSTLDIQILQNLPNKQSIPYKEKIKEVGSINLVYIGRIAPEKNTLFALKTLLNCKQKINFDIYGPIYNESYWGDCNETIKQFPINIKVNYKGILPHSEIDKTLEEYHSLFLPSTGENFGHIIVESMMNSCIPVISTNTPWKDLASKQIGFDINLNSPKEFSSKIDQLAQMGQSAFNIMSMNTHAFGKEIMNNNELIEKYISLFNL